MPHRLPRRLPLLLLAFVLLLTACDPERTGSVFRVSNVSTSTPSVGGELIIRGAGFSDTQNTVTIGGMTIPQENLASWNHSEIKLTIPAGTPNGTLSVTAGEQTAEYGEPIHVIAKIEIDPLERIGTSKSFSVTARALDADGQPVPGARLILRTTDNLGKITPDAYPHTDNRGEATAVLDLEGVTSYVELLVWAPPLYATATYAENGKYSIGSEVTLTDGAISLPLYFEEGSEDLVTATTLNRQPKHPPVPQADLANLPLSSASISPSTTPATREPTEIIVAYRPTFSLSSAVRANTLAAAGLERKASSGRLDLVRVPEGVSLEEALTRLNADPRVEYAEPNPIVRLAGLPADPRLYQQWGAFAIGAPAAWTVSDGSGVIVAVIDSAIDLTHPDLTHALLPGYDFCADGPDCLLFDDDPHAATDAANHGTHVAGIIAAAANNGTGTVGIAPGAKILPVKVFPEGQDTTDGWALVHAIYWAAGLPVEGAPLNPTPAHVINLSLGSEGNSKVIQDAVDAAVDAGVLVVAATGNDFGDLPVNYPAALPNVLGVGAIDQDWTRADFSNYGPGLDLVAPGRQVLANRPGGGDHYMTGTSMATPHAAGAAALLLARDPSLSPAQVKSFLMNSTYWPDHANPDEFGAGVLRIDGALGLPAPTNDTDRYAPLTVGAINTILDLREGVSPGFSVPALGPGDTLPVTLKHGGREYTGSLSSP